MAPLVLQSGVHHTYFAHIKHGTLAETWVVATPPGAAAEAASAAGCHQMDLYASERSHWTHFSVCARGDITAPARNWPRHQRQWLARDWPQVYMDSVRAQAHARFAEIGTK